MKLTKMLLGVVAGGAFTLLAADPAGVVDGWDLRRSKTAKPSDSGVVLTGVGEKDTSLNRFKSINAKTGNTVTLKFTVSGQGKFAAGCHLYSDRNAWVGIVKGEVKNVDGEQLLEYELVLPKGARGEVAAIRPYFAAGEGEVITLKAFECKVSK